MARYIYWAKEYNVNPRDLQPVMRQALLIVDRRFGACKKRLTITCTGGGAHTPTSLHPWGYAFDVRIRQLTRAQKIYILNKTNDDFEYTPYQIELHGDHFHVEYDPSDWKDVLK